MFYRNFSDNKRLLGRPIRYKIALIVLRYVVRGIRGVHSFRDVCKARREQLFYYVARL